MDRVGSIAHRCRQHAGCCYVLRVDLMEDRQSLIGARVGQGGQGQLALDPPEPDAVETMNLGCVQECVGLGDEKGMRIAARFAHHLGEA